MLLVMFIELRPDDPRPVYRQIVDEVQREVAVGVLKAGDALPAARQLATELKLNPNTVQHAYRTLAREGIVKVRKGLGTFVTAAPKEGRPRGAVIARQIAERALRDAFRHGLLASDLMRALEEIAPKVRRP
ncbi:MAG: GntR family transcriptional regulator [Acidobacteria bacterium]|nr:MAG: GntR family transcriptional regulator [Acidobacteriota bacterium]PYR76919.1 MAG: GntR family transcriptional regulator [Acidobacteriota bacterium]